MGTIDERIVKLSFDNKGFESGIQKTLSSLEALNKALEKTDNRQAAKELSKSMNDINKILKNNNLGNLDKLLNKQSGFSKITDSVSKMGNGLINAFKKIDFTGIGYILSSMFKGSTDGASALARGVESVTAKFSHLQVVAATALANITNRMVNAGIAMSKALTIDPLKDGFREYETKMNAMQTIFANTSHKGTTYDDIKKALNELNEYSDKTIYNFGQMTDNIGKFTAAGVDLETSVTAVKGLANLAAMSGVDNARAQGVMYQASQALSKGYFQLMDWRSFSNNGMGNDRFKQLLIETGDLLGTGASAAIKAAGSFDESLSKSKWLTNDVMNEALKMLAGYYTEADLLQMGFNKKQAQNVMQLAKQAEESATQIRTVTQLFDTMKEAVGSGWAQTWEWIVGDKEQATKTLTDISKAFENMIKPGIEARNKMFEEWNKDGGRGAVISGFTNIFEGVGKVAGSVKDAFRDIFPAMTGQRLIEISKGFEKLTENLKISDKTAAKIKDTFKGVFSVFDLAKTGITSIFKAFSGGGGLFSGLGNIFLSTTSSIGKFLNAINEGVKSSGIFDEIASGISNGLKNITNGFKQAGEIIKGMFKYLLDFDFGPVFEIFKPFATGLGKGIQDIMSGLGKMLGGFNLNGLLSSLSLLAGKGVFDKIKSVFDDTAESVKGLTKIFKDMTAIPKDISEVLKSTSEYLKAMTTDINAGALLKIAGAIALLALSLSTLATIDQDGLNTALSGITTLFVELVAAFAMLTKVTTVKGTGKGGLLGNILGGFLGKGELVTTAASLIGFASAILILTAAVKTLSNLKPEELMTGLAGIAASMLILIGAVKALDGIDGNIKKASSSMIALGIALNILAIAVKQFGQLDIYDMAQGLSGIGIMLAELIIFMELINTKSASGFKVGTILGLAVALTILSNAVKQFGQMDIYDMIQGMAGIGAMLLVIASFGKLTSSVIGLTKTAVGVGVLAASLMLLQVAVAKFGSMKLEQLGTGILGLAAALGVIAVAMSLMNDLSLITSAVGLIAVGAALQLITKAVQDIGSLSLEQVGTGVLGLAAALGVLAVAMDLMSTGMLGAAGMVVMAAGLAILTPQLLALSQLDGMAAAIAISVMAAALGVLAVAGLAATAIAPGLAILSITLVAFGLGCLAAGVGVTLFATGLATLAAVGAGGMFGITEALRNLINLLPKIGTKLGEFITNLAVAIAQGIPQVADAIGQAMLGLLESIRTYGPQIITVGVELITLLCSALTTAAPQLASAATTLILTLINSLASSGAQIASAGADLIISLLEGLSSRAGDIIQAGIDLAISLLEGLSEGINNNADRISSALESAFDAALSLVGIALKAGFKALGGKAVDGFSDGVSGGAKDVGRSIKKPIEEAKKTAKSAKSEFKSAGEDMIKGLADGIKSSSAAKDGINKLVDDAVNKAKDASSKFTSAGEDWADKLASGIESGSSGVKSAVASVIDSAVSKAKSGNGQMRSAGASMMDGFAAGIRSRAASAAIAAASAVAQAISAAKAKLDINSPSKVFMQIGKWTVMGMEKGLDNNAYRVSRSATNMADGAITAMRNSISTIANAINDNIDAQPTIRPVLDLSNVEAGARSLNGMLGSSQLSASLSGDMSRSIGTIQNGNNNGELLSAIKDLQGNVGNSGDTYQINGITYDDGSAISSAVQTLIRAAKIERRM
jgi:hypothetical protein